MERFADSPGTDVILSRLQTEQPVKGSPIDDLCLKAIEEHIREEFKVRVAERHFL
jgi:hypothetical protein